MVNIRRDETTDRLYFRQLLAGRDFAVGDPLATQMVNFVYVIGDRRTGECVLVDPAYAVDELVDAVEADGMHVTGVLATHYHPDHVGGSMMGYTIEGVAALLERVAVSRSTSSGPRCHGSREPSACRSASSTAHDPGDVVRVGERGDRAAAHTRATRPAASASSSTAGWSPATRCSSTAAAAPTCPAANAEAMYDSLQRLAALPDAPWSTPATATRCRRAARSKPCVQQNYVFKPDSKAQWLTMFGR